MISNLFHSKGSNYPTFRQTLSQNVEEEKLYKAKPPQKSSMSLLNFFSQKIANCHSVRCSNKRYEKRQKCHAKKKKGHNERSAAASPTSNMGTPQVFISHAWKYLFLETLEALKNHFKDDLDVFAIWFDLFAINQQHIASDLPSEWLRIFFKDAIKSFGHAVMVLSPWDNPIPYTRACWCVLKAFYTTTQEVSSSPWSWSTSS